MTNEKGFFDKLKTYLVYAGPGTFAFFTVVIIPFIYGIYLTLQIGMVYLMFTILLDYKIIMRYLKMKCFGLHCG